MSDEIFVYLISMPSKVHECVTPNPDGSYSVFINESLSPDARKKAYKHAIKHISGNDFEKFDTNQVELDAHSNS